MDTSSFFGWIYTVITTVYNTIFGFLVDPIADAVEKDVDVTVQAAKKWADDVYQNYLGVWCGHFNGCGGVADEVHKMNQIVDNYTSVTVPAFRRSITNAVALYTGLGLFAVFGIFLFFVIV
jgi:hypothetical protein